MRLPSRPFLRKRVDAIAVRRNRWTMIAVKSVPGQLSSRLMRLAKGGSGSQLCSLSAGTKRISSLVADPHGYRTMSGKPQEQPLTQ